MSCFCERIKFYQRRLFANYRRIGGGGTLENGIVGVCCFNLALG